MKKQKTSDPSEGIFSVTIMVTNAEGQTLGVSRKTDHEDFGLPAGKLNPGETPEQAAKRELFEETGLTATKLEVIYEHPLRTENGIVRPNRCYRAVEYLGKPESKEGAKVAWLSLGDFLGSKCSFRDYNRQLFASLMSNPVKDDRACYAGR